MARCSSSSAHSRTNGDVILADQSSLSEVGLSKQIKHFLKVIVQVVFYDN